MTVSGLQPPTPTAPPTEIVEDVPPPGSLDEAWDLVLGKIDELWREFVGHLPLVVLALVVLLIGVLVSRYAERAGRRAFHRTRADAMVVSLAARLVRLSVLVVFLLLAASVAGISVTSALAALGLAGLAIAFALQSILENFISGILLLIRKPFVAGDQIITGDFEGTVQDIDLRVTHLVDYDGESILVPNAEVFSKPLVNLTKRGRRRSRVALGIDYRDDHNAVVDLLEAAVDDVDGVLSSPAPLVLATALGDSAVEFEVLYWTSPEISEVIRVRDRVTRTVKDAIEGAGMTIPWPIRTLTFDEPSPSRAGPPSDRE